MKVSGQPFAIQKPLYPGHDGSKAPQPKETDHAARPHHEGHGKAHAKPHAQVHALASDRITTQTKPGAPEPTPQRTAERLGHFSSGESAPTRPGGNAPAPAPQRTAEKLGHFNSGTAAPQRPGSGESTQAPTQERTAELLGRFRASGTRPGGAGGAGEAQEPGKPTTDIRRGPPQPGDLRSNHAEHRRGHRGARSIRAFERNVHNALQEVRQGLRESGLSGEELRSVRKELNGLEKEFRSSLKETRVSLRGKHLGPQEAASAVAGAFQGLVGGLESLTAGQTESSGGVTSGSKSSQQFVGKAGGALQSEGEVGAPTGPEEPAGPVTDRAPASTTEAGHGPESGPATHAHPLRSALREGFASFLSSLESLASSIQNEEQENRGPLTTIAVNTQASEPSEGASSQVQLAVSSYTEVNTSISIAGNGEELNLAA